METITNIHPHYIKDLSILHKDKLEKSQTFCQECKLEFQSIRGLRQHEGKIHTKSEKILECNECHKLFKNKYSLKAHLKQVHEKMIKLPCEKCGKILFSKYTLKNHQRKNHPPQIRLE
ncbi:hypothetical protein SteCoe_25832 [Stentor coeruleus]|uniref:C2H2-type domain-containing protein n=1 Tax=Stentor coeruleus TaxID=5963 RepID=A0A1R2BEM6_9CILI|nr:hypothetical protein SteCoe_25832 [Stentor coeruleus]